MRFGLVGPSYTARSSAIADEECINLFAETRESSGAMVASKEYGGTGTGGTKNYLWTPGLSLFAALPAVPRAVCEANGRLFVVAGSNAYEVFPNGLNASIAPAQDDGNPACIVSNGNQLLIISGGRAYCYNLTFGTNVEVTSQLVAIPLMAVYCDGYFVVMFQNSDKGQISAPLDGTTWPGLYVNQVSVYPENIVSLAVNHRELWVFGTRHTQVYQNTGSAEIFDVIPGAFIETGSAATFAPCKVDNSVFWISEDERGGRMAWRSNGYTPTRISTHAVEIDLGAYPTLAGMTSYSYQDGGHLFWVLYVSGSQWSWVYDVGEGLWHKRAQWNPSNSTWSAHASWNHAYAFGLHLVGDWATGSLYTLSQNNLTDVGVNIRRYRRTPTIIDEMNWISHKFLNVDFEMGNLTTIVPTDTPAFASSLRGPKPGGQAVSTSLGNVPWSNPTNVLTRGAQASCTLTPNVSTASTSTATGSNSGGGVAWSNPTLIDSTGASVASVDLTGAGAANNSAAGVAGTIYASPSNQNPAPVTGTSSPLFPSTPTTSATLYIPIFGTFTSSLGTGKLTLNYSSDGGATWKLVQTWTATFAQTTAVVNVSGITDLNSLKVQVILEASCSPTGFSYVTAGSGVFTTPPIYAIIPGAGQPNSASLVGALSGLTIPAGQVVTGLQVSYQASYSGDAPSSLQISLNVGDDPQESPAISVTPTTYTVGGAAFLWNYSAWDAATLASLKVSFQANTAGTTTVNINELVVTVHYAPAATSTDAIDITQFPFPTIPATQKPSGFILNLQAFADVIGTTLTVQMLKAGVPVGVSQSLPLSANGDQSVALVFGGLKALFGASWTISDLNQFNFGVRVTASTAGNNPATISVGYTTLQLYCPPIAPAYAQINNPPVLVDGDGNPRPPQAMLRWSDDRGKTWSNEHVVNCGDIGQYKARAIFWRLGRSRYRVYELSMTDPLPWVIVDGYLEAGQ